jgi:hypothetical protein
METETIIGLLLGVFVTGLGIGAIAATIAIWLWCRIER